MPSAALWMSDCCRRATELISVIEPGHSLNCISTIQVSPARPSAMHLAICGGERSPSRGLRIAVCLQLPYCPALRLNFARI